MELKFNVYLYYRLTLLIGLALELKLADVVKATVHGILIIGPLLQLKQHSPLVGIHYIFVLIAS